MMFSAYLCLEQLPDEVKVQHHIKVGGAVPRYDLTRFTGCLPGLEALTNKKGQVVMYLQSTRGLINSPDGRRADCFLMAKGSLNFSSLYLLARPDTTAPFVGFGNPMSAKTYGAEAKQNPFYECRNDGYIFIVSPDWRKIEILIVPNGKFTIIGQATMVQRGELQEALDAVRTASATFYPYGGEIPKLW